MNFEIKQGDALTRLREMPDESVQCCVTSPPYFGLRDYGIDGQLGLESTPQEFVKKLVEIFREVRRVLTKDGTAWVNLGDSYAGSGKGLYSDGNCYLSDKSAKQKTNVGSVGVRIGTIEGDAGHTHGVKPPAGYKAKDLMGIPWRVAFALQDDGWYLRQDIIWHKPNPMPESVTDRCTKSHEYIFLLSKSARYYFDSTAIAEPAATEENRPAGVVRDRLYDYDSKQAIISGRRSWNGSKFDTGKTAIHQLNKMQKDRDRTCGNRNGLGASTLDKRKPTPEQEDAFFGNAPTNLYRCGGDGETRNKRSVWTVGTKPFSEAHFATFPPKLIEPCILAGSREGNTVLDPFNGAGTTGLVSLSHRRNYIGIELNPEYIKISEKRLADVQVNLF